MSERIVSTVHTANDMTVMPNSTAKTLLGAATVILPSWARSIWAVVAKSGIEVPVAGVGFNPLLEVESNDISLTPFQVFPPPVANIVGNASHNVSRPEVYAANIPVNGGEQISIYGTALVAPGATMTGFVGGNLVISNERPEIAPGWMAPQRHAKVGTLTSTGTTASADVAGTRYQFSGATKITELQAIANATTLVASKGFAGHAKYTSPEFKGVSEVKMDFAAIAGGIATTGNSYIDGVSRLKVEIPLLPGKGQVNIQDYAYFSNISSTAGYFGTGVLYE